MTNLGIELIGRHLLIDLVDCDSVKLDDPALIRNLLQRGATLAETQLLDDKVHHFSPQGVTGVALLAESHLSIHTWPEKRFAAIDLFSCGSSFRDDAKIDAIVSFFQRGLGAARIEVRIVDRGLPYGRGRP